MPTAIIEVNAATWRRGGTINQHLETSVEDEDERVFQQAVRVAARAAVIISQIDLYRITYPNSAQYLNTSSIRALLGG